MTDFNAKQYALMFNVYKKSISIVVVVVVFSRPSNVEQNQPNCTANSRLRKT
jgi:hypothetical protein